MSETKVWHNPRCSKSRQGLEYLNEKKAEFEIFEYMKKGIEPTKLAEIIKSSDQPLSDFIRTNEPEFKQLGLKADELTVEAFAELAAQHPKLLQRPIVVKDGKAVVGRPVSKIDEIM